MEKIILIKYAELVTKKDNRKYFIKILEQNINHSLKGLSYEIKRDYFRMFIFTDNIEEVKLRLKSVFGIYEVVEAYKVEDMSIENIKNKTLEICSNEIFDTFKVVTNRSNKNYPINSMEISRQVGAYILSKKQNIKVDVHNPEFIINIELRNESVYIYGKPETCLGGYPVESLGSALMMISGGIDSPVAAFLSIKRGIKLNYLYFESIPHTSLEAREKVRKLCNILSKYNPNGKLYVCSLTEIQESIYKYTKDDYLITLLRRSMYRIATNVAKNKKCLALVNGESVGQVASQTLTSMKVINEVTNYPILRPLCSFDKNEIINIAKKIDTYETSILPYEDCCTIFVPKHPVINPLLNIALEEESKIDIVELEKKAIESIIEININEKDNFNEYL